MTDHGTWLLLALLLAAGAAHGAAGPAAGSSESPQPAAAGTRGGPDDPYFRSSGAWGQAFPDQWALRELRVYTDLALPPAEVVVAVIDTGLDYRHEDFAAERLWRNPGEARNGRDDDGNGYRDDLVGWDFVDGDPNPWDDSGHGTHIAGIIAACTDNGLGIAGVNGAARIMPLKVANFSGQARSSAVASAIHYAVDHGARVINLSLGGEVVTELEREAAARAAAAGVLIVVAAGNKGLDTSRFGYPSLPGALVVGATDEAGRRAGFSNFGSHLDVAAPGVDVLSLRARDTDFIGLSEPPDYPPGAAIVGTGGAYYRASGTSFAAALVSGLASRIFAARPAYTAEDVRRALAAGAVDLAQPGVDQLTGHGRVDLMGALAADPERYLEARLAGVELTLEAEQVWLNFTGSATGRDFAGARVEVRVPAEALPEIPEDRRMSRRERREAEDRREALAQWQPLGEPIVAPVSNQVLARHDLESLLALTDGIHDWDVRLVVAAKGGGEHESRMRMALPVPEPEPAGEQADAR